MVDLKRRNRQPKWFFEHLKFSDNYQHPRFGSFTGPKGRIAGGYCKPESRTFTLVFRHKSFEVVEEGNQIPYGSPTSIEEAQLWE